MKDYITLKSGLIFFCVFLLVSVANDNYKINRYLEKELHPADLRDRHAPVIPVIVVIVLLLLQVFSPRNF